MNRIEAQKAFVDGKKIRHESWSLRYEYLKGGLAYDQDCNRLRYPYVFFDPPSYNDAWEVVDEHAGGESDEDPGEGWEFCSRSEAEEWRCKDYGQSEWATAYAMPVKQCGSCQYRRRIKQGPKLVRKDIRSWTKSGRPVAEGNPNPVVFDKIHGYVYDDPNDSESDIVSPDPSLLWSAKAESEIGTTFSDAILDGRVIRLLPVAVIVEE